MKTIQLVILTIFLSIATVANAQDNLTQYTYSIYISNSSSQTCVSERIAYFSPIITHKFEDDYRLFDQKKVVGSQLATRWKNKVSVHFNINKDYCYAHTTDYWEKSFTKIDAVRDKWMKFYKDSGYKIYSNYTFGFR